jgi:riboflavin synthase
MFTGLIDDIGTITEVSTTDAGRELRIGCRYDDVVTGESISVNGACLTVRDRGNAWFLTAAVVTTLSRTTIGGWRAGRRVNLERALRLGDRLGGHLVQGHVDGVARVDRVGRRSDAVLIEIAVPPEIEALAVPFGSIAVDGVSLTINRVAVGGMVELSIIDHTLRHTTLGALGRGDEVHVEADLVGKYLQRIAAPYMPPTRQP